MVTVPNPEMMADDSNPDLDLSQIASWLEKQGFPAREIELLSGDVSPRRYARVQTASRGSLVLAVYPEALKPACARFGQTTELLRRYEVPVPAILAQDCETGLMLLQDAGKETLYDLKGQPWSRLLPYFETAVILLRRLAGLPAGEVSRLNPPLDEAVLRRELAQTWELFLHPRGLTGNRRQTQRLRTELDALCAQLGKEPTAPCHRDFMARNLVPVAAPDREPGARPDLIVLDHQDLRLGPPAYDLASLLNDSLFPPQALEDQLLGLAGLDVHERMSYHRAAAQRTLKAVGTFVSFARRGSNRHLPLVPSTLNRAGYHLRRLPETRDLARELAGSWSLPNLTDLIDSDV